MWTCLLAILKLRQFNNLLKNTINWKKEKEDKETNKSCMLGATISAGCCRLAVSNYQLYNTNIIRFRLILLHHCKVGLGTMAL